MDIQILVRSYCLCASSVKQWSSKYADKINGTDGTIAPPFLVDEHFKAYLYSTDICRYVPCYFYWYQTGGDPRMVRS